MNHFFVIAGGSIDDKFALRCIKRASGAKIIAADAGMEFLYRNRIVPDVIVGDFDSVDGEAFSWFDGQEGIDWRRLNPQKDDTDTEAAVHAAMELGAERVTILGGTGSRLDHVLGNIELLGIGLKQGVPMELVDANNRIRMADKSLTIRREEQFGHYISLIPYTVQVEHVTLRGMKYPLSDYCLKGFCTIGISNEITGPEAEILFDGGILLVVESQDAEPA